MSRDRNLLLKFMCVHPRVCVFILPFLCFFFPLFILCWSTWLLPFFFSKKREKDWDWWGRGEDLRGDEAEETVIRI